MDSFLTACGATDFLTLEIEGPGFSVPDRRVFPLPYVLIGRDERAGLQLDHDAVSRRHTYLQVVEGRLFFIDLDSRIGTTAGAVRAESGWVEPGQGFEIGPFTVRYIPFPGVALDGPPPPNPLLARSASGSSDLPRVTLEFQNRSTGHSTWRMSQVLALVGSSSRCKIRLFDSQVSRLHCALLRTSQGLWAIDLLGRGGIAINGMSMRSGPLLSGDFLSLGKIVVRTIFEDPAATEGASLPVVWSGHDQSGVGGGKGAFGYRPDPGSLASATPAHAMSPHPVPTTRFTPELTGRMDLASQEPALALLLTHFGQMQQQMMDQFQQSMMMMLQMFSGMHRDQMGLVKEELERLRELNNEIALIKAELNQRSLPVAPSPPPAAPHSSPPVVPRAEPTRPVNDGPLSVAGSVPPRPMPGPVPQPPGHHAPDPPPSPSGPGTEAAKPSPAPPAPPRPLLPPPGEPSADIHAWLNERLSAITTEQQTLWQKIMTTIRGEK